MIWAGANDKTYVNEETVNYITKYISKQDKDHTEYKPKVLTSAGIGGAYIKREDAKRNKYNKTEQKNTTRQGADIK